MTDWEPLAEMFVALGAAPSKKLSMFDKTESTLSSFINQASPQALTSIVSQVISRLDSLSPEERMLFIKNVQRDFAAKQVFEQIRHDRSDFGSSGGW